MHPCQGNSVAIGCPVVYYTRTAHAFSTEIKCRYCTCILVSIVCLFVRIRPGLFVKRTGFAAAGRDFGSSFNTRSSTH